MPSGAAIFQWCGVSGGWFDIPGLRQGERSFAQQATGLEWLWQELREAQSVLDLGCAEGLIALECARRGVPRVDAVDYKPEFIATGKDYAEQQLLDVNFIEANLDDGLPRALASEYDIVLLLAIVHKMQHPKKFIAACAARARHMIVVRLPKGSTGITRGKHWPYRECNVIECLRDGGFAMVHQAAGPNDELVQYYRRNS